MSGTDETSSKIVSYSAFWPNAQASKLLTFGGLFPPMQESKAVTFADLFPFMQCSKAATYVALFLVPAAPAGTGRRFVIKPTSGLW